MRTAAITETSEPDWPAPKRLVAPSIICGLFVFMPLYLFPLRGTLVCLFPALACGSWRLARRGMLLGATANMGFQLAWMAVPALAVPTHATGYSHALEFFMSPTLSGSVAMSGGAISYGGLFVSGVVLWTVLMFSIWQLLWPSGRPGGGRDTLARILVGAPIAALVAAVTAAIIWMVGDIRSEFRQVAIIVPVVANCYMLLGQLTARLARHF